MQTIPDDVLSKIVAHRPHLGAIARNLRACPSRARQFEKAIADAYLLGETRLTVEETWKLAACCDGRGYGESVTTEPAKVTIDHENYGERTTFASLEEAEAAIHGCGPEFADVRLTTRLDSVVNERGEIVGHLDDQPTEQEGDGPTYRVVRQTIHGERSIIASGLTAEEADELADHHTAGPDGVAVGCRFAEYFAEQEGNSDE